MKLKTLTYHLRQVYLLFSIDILKFINCNYKLIIN